VGEVEVDIAPHIGKDAGRVKIPVVRCSLPNCFIEAEFSVAECLSKEEE
jgi:hypothetical protein